MTLTLPKKRKLRRRRVTPNLKNSNSLYLAYYDIQNFSMELTHPLMTFKSHSAAEIYVENRNFEFQTLMLASKNSQQSYILDSLKAILNGDYCITVSDLKLAGEYFDEEYSRRLLGSESEEEKEKLFWDILQKYISPFKITMIEHMSKNYT